MLLGLLLPQLSSFIYVVAAGNNAFVLISMETHVSKLSFGARAPWPL